MNHFSAGRSWQRPRMLFHPTMFENHGSCRLYTTGVAFPGREGGWRGNRRIINLYQSVERRVARDTSTVGPRGRLISTSLLSARLSRRELAPCRRAGSFSFELIRPGSTAGPPRSNTARDFCLKSVARGKESCPPAWQYRNRQKNLGIRAPI